LIFRAIFGKLGVDIIQFGCVVLWLVHNVVWDGWVCIDGELDALIMLLLLFITLFCFIIGLVMSLGFGVD